MGVVVPFSFLAGVIVGMVIMYIYYNDTPKKPNEDE